MSFRRLSFKASHAGIALSVSALLVCVAQAGGLPRGRAIDFSDSRSDQVITNLNQVATQKNGVREFDPGDYAPSTSIFPNDSLSGMPAFQHVSRPRISSRRLQELRDRDKNWMFLTPEELVAGSKAKNLLKPGDDESDPKEKLKLSAMEQWYWRQSFGSDDSFRPGKQNGNPESSARREGSEGLDGVKDTYGFSKSALLTESAAEVNRRFGDISGIGGNSIPTEQSPAQKARMAEFKQLLGISVPSQPGLGLLNSFSGADPTRPATPPVSGLDTHSGSKTPELPDAHSSIPNWSSLEFGKIPTIPAGVPDQSMRAYNLWSPTPDSLLPKVDRPKVKPPTPTFTAPTRSFY